MATRKVRVSKAATKKVAGKPATRKVATKATAKVAAKAPAKVANAVYVTAAGSPYQALSGNKKVFSAFTIALLGATGFLRINKASISKGGKGDLKRFKKVAGPSAARYWATTNKFVTEDGISDDGIANLRNRLDGKGGFKTTLELVGQVHTVLTKGGDLKVDGVTYKFDTQV